MRTRAIYPAARHAAILAFSAGFAGAFGFLFLSTAPVRGVEDVYQALHLNGIMTLDDLFGLGHIVIYAALTMIMGRFTRTAGGWARIFAVLMTLGIGVEFAQGIVGGRSCSLDDALADFLGICIGFFALVVMGPPRPRRRRKRRSV